MEWSAADLSIRGLTYFFVKPGTRSGFGVRKLRSTVLNADWEAKHRLGG